MVVRFQVHKFFILLGIIICILSITDLSELKHQDVLQSNISNIRTLIIDAGHGGADGGAVGIDGTIESQINLQIASKLNSLSKLCGIPTIMTRTSENIAYPKDTITISEKKIFDQNERLGLIKDHPNGILYSIHQNTYPNESISGIQTLYGHNESSQVLGTLLQTQFNEAIPNKTNRVAAEISDTIYLMKHCNCTAVLIECGFISNAKECKLLQTDSYQKTLTIIMLGGYLQYMHL